MNLSLEEKRLLARHRVNQLKDAVKAMDRDPGYDQKRQNHILDHVDKCIISAGEAIAVYEQNWRECYCPPAPPSGADKWFVSHEVMNQSNP